MFNTPCTGKSTKLITNVNGLQIQYNKELKMYRLHPEVKAPNYLKGYTPHFQKLEHNLLKWKPF